MSHVVQEKEKGQGSSSSGGVRLAQVSSTPQDQKKALWKSIENRSFRGEIEPMPVLTIDMKDVKYIQVSPTEAKPVVRLPSTGVESLQPPAGLTSNDFYEWELAKLLEGRSACIEHLPSYKPGSSSFCASGYLGWACRHADVLRDSPDNWIPVSWMLKNSRHKLCTPNDLFQAVIHNEKGRYQFSKPQYFRAKGKRESQGMGRGADVEPYYLAKSTSEQYKDIRRA